MKNIRELCPQSSVFLNISQRFLHNRIFFATTAAATAIAAATWLFYAYFLSLEFPVKRRLYVASLWGSMNNFVQKFRILNLFVLTFFFFLYFLVGYKLSKESNFSKMFHKTEKSSLFSTIILTSNLKKTWWIH